MIKYLYVTLAIAFALAPINYSIAAETEGRKAVIATLTTINVVELTPSDDNKSLIVKEVHTEKQAAIIKDPSVQIEESKIKEMIQKAADKAVLKQGESVTLGIGTDLGNLVSTAAGVAAPLVSVATTIIPKAVSAVEVGIGLLKNLLI